MRLPLGNLRRFFAASRASGFGGCRTDEQRDWAGPAQPSQRLADPALNRHLAEDGYAVINGFIDPEGVAQLSALFESETSTLHNRPFASSIRSNDRGYKERVSQGIGKILAPSIENHFCGYRYCFAGFLVKAPASGIQKEEATVPLHQDIAMVDESRYQGLGIWVPLTDVTSENGCLSVVPGSHAYSPNLRWPFSPFAFKDDVSSLSEKLVELPLKAGSAIVYCQKLIHTSGPNLTPATRVVAGALAAPMEASLIYYHQATPDDDALDVYSVPDNFYVTQAYGTAPIGLAKIARVRKPD